LQQLLSFN